MRFPILALLLVLLPLPAPASLLVNGGFEAGSLGAWTAGNVATDVVPVQSQQTGTVTVYEGTYFLTMADTPSEATSATQSGTGTLAPGNVLVLTGRIQTEDLGDDDYGRAWIRVLDAGGAVLDSAESGVLVTPSFQWNQFQVFLDIPVGAVSWRVDLEGTLAFGSYVNVFWDDLTLRETGTTGVGDGVGAPGVAFAPVRPNPAREAVELRYRLAAAVDPELTILDVRGRRVARLAAPGSPGDHRVTWDGRDESGAPAPAGIYFARLVLGGESLTRKIVRVP